MKRALTVITALILSAAMLAGCAAEPPAAQASTDPLRGTINDNIFYTSDFMELTFTAPEHWYISADVKLEKPLWSSDMSFDMFANYYYSTALWVCVAYADLAVAGKTDCSEETYFDLFKEKMREEMSEDALSNNEFSDYTDVKIGSNSFKAMPIKNTKFGTNHYYYIRRKDDYMLFIFVQIPDEVDIDIDTVMANFS